MKTIRKTLSAKERLKSRKLMDALFAEGTVFKQYPIRLVWKVLPYREEQPVQMGVAVPKRNMHQAVDRNRMKRLMRESYRLNKEGLYHHAASHKKSYALLFIATLKTPLTFVVTQEKIILLLQRLIHYNEKPVKQVPDISDPGV